MHMEDPILDEQLAYYRARAPEYDAPVAGVTRLVARATPLLQRLGPCRQILELACGTGTWTPVLLTIGQEITAIDAAPEMLQIARQKLGDASVRYEHANLFHWEPMHAYDLVFFADWLSHVPPGRLDAFLEKVRRAIRPQGYLVMIDQYAPTAEDQRMATGEIYATRPLHDGRRFTIVKVFYDLTLPQDKLRNFGFAVAVHTLSDVFALLSGARQE
jgi:ubiquinone/menaquinone biosynthesis C-methylase UbiE